MIDTVALRKKVLDLAIRGKLVPQDPNDEPASVLLERIREQKQQMVKEGKLKAKDIKDDSVIFVGDDNLHYEKFTDGTIKCIEDEIPFELPGGWAWSRLQSFCFPITDGTHQTPTYSDEGYVFLSAKNVTKGKIDWDNVMHIPESLHKELYARIAPQKNDILLAKNGTVGVAAIVDRDCIFDIYVTLAVLRAISEGIVPQYLLTAILSSTVQAFFKSSLIGIGVQNLHLEHIRKTPVPIPPTREQKAIANQVNLLEPYILQVEEQKNELHTEIRHIKSKILDLAIRGKLVPQDPNDEPASVLLERIRAEKEDLIKQGKIKRDKKESIIFKGDDNSYYEKFVDYVEDITDEIPFEVAQGVELVRLKFLWGLLSGRDLAPSEYNDCGKGIPYITGASNFVNGEIQINRWTEKPQVISYVGDLLITCKGTIGEIAINDFGEAHIARQIMAIRNILDLNLDYLAICIKYHIEFIKASAKGLIPGISREDILNLILPIPTKIQQISTVQKVNELFAIIDTIEKSLS